MDEYDLIEEYLVIFIRQRVNGARRRLHLPTYDYTHTPVGAAWKGTP